MTAGESGHALVGQSKEQLQALEQAWSAELDAISGANQQLDLSRGKPGVEQLALSDGLETMIAGDYISIDGTDTRNYGGLMGIAEARALGAHSCIGDHTASQSAATPAYTQFFFRRTPTWTSTPRERWPASWR